MNQDEAAVFITAISMSIPHWDEPYYREDAKMNFKLIEKARKKNKMKKGVR